VIERFAREPLFLVELTVFHAEIEESGQTFATRVPGKGSTAPRAGANVEIVLDELAFEFRQFAGDYGSPTSSSIHSPGNCVVILLGVGVGWIKGADQF
jgi:hypothetical protein